MSNSDIDRLLSRLKELEELLTFPSVPGHMEKASELALSLARNAPNGNIANLAMKLLSEITIRRRGGGITTGEADVGNLMTHLRTALLDARLGKRT